MPSTCAHPDCNAECTDDDYCSGCHSYVCEKHSTEDPWGMHETEEHWEELDDDE